MNWAKLKERLKEALPDNVYQLWIEPLQFLQQQGNHLYLSTPDKYFSAYVRQNFSALIEEKLSELGLVAAKVVYREKTTDNQPVSASCQGGAGVQLRLPHMPENNSKFRMLHPCYTFDEFMVGESNILAESACRSMAAEDGVVGPCLYINSGTGLGKSHLTHAVAHQVLAASPMTRLHYLTAKQFAAEMVQNIQANSMERFKRKYHENCDILLVEDVHSLVGKKKTQEELNDILDSLIKSGKRVVLTANSAPGELVDIDSDFRSRMTSGLVTTIKAPDITTRQRIVLKKAVQHRLTLDDHQVGFLAQHVRGDVRKIESALIAIRARAGLAGGHIDLDLVREVVASIVGANQVLTAAMIGELVSGQFKVSVKDLQSKSRKKEISTPRQIAMYLARKHTDQSLVEIGRTFNRDHSTVLHAIKVVSSKLVRDGSVNAQLEILSNKVKQL